MGDEPYYLEHEGWRWYEIGEGDERRVVLDNRPARDAHLAEHGSTMAGPLYYSAVVPLSVLYEIVMVAL